MSKVKNLKKCWKISPRGPILNDLESPVKHSQKWKKYWVTIEYDISGEGS